MADAEEIDPSALLGMTLLDVSMFVSFRIYSFQLDPEGIITMVATGEAEGRNPWLWLRRTLSTLKGLNRLRFIRPLRGRLVVVIIHTPSCALLTRGYHI